MAQMIKIIFPIIFGRKNKHAAVLDGYLIQQNNDFIQQQNGDKIYIRS
jgi:hypothetical protein